MMLLRKSCGSRMYEKVQAAVCTFSLSSRKFLPYIHSAP